ncbi:hypothetical protein B0J15DRAFT_15320 [Fusarium solani]|uniref:Clr5 domain-containing protein n=1 Tax=Fusarium solani TaxID=169388 RepID=A0A9P9L747_FUSSL|nr:uncharacterized protein B0J15DRAFT_15320 [Fusarium solani]KAH7275417.1 hypothetical protein B0J15DRAFT_15320 [Fusarium solani]
MDPDPKFLHIPYNKRWEYLKDTIIQLYLEEGEKVDKVASRMKSEYSFDALPSAYKYQFRKWGIKKSTSSAVKAQAVRVQLKRKRDASTSDLTVVEGGREKSLDKKKLKRFLQDDLRRRHEPTLAGGIFLRMNLPYNALVGNFIYPGGPPSPFASLCQSHPNSPANIVVNSPGNHRTPSSQPVGPSPTTQLIRDKAHLERADLFIQGQYQELLLQLGREERKVVADWLHDFWIHSFMTAKYWGRGPETWTPGLIAAKTLGSVELEGSAATPGDAASTPRASRIVVDPPSQLCRWSIHYHSDMKYESVPSPPPENDNEQDIEDESTWLPWGASRGHPTPADTMRSVLSDNSFSRIDEHDVPLSTSSITRAVNRSQDQIEVDSWGFAIMARNLESLRALEGEDEEAMPPHDLKHIHPFHLAASHLDGAHNCCLILNHLLASLWGEFSLQNNFTNGLGHTVLDSLMINILRSHTSISPGEVYQGFEKQNRFPGEEVDICGRWDADSRCIRQLYASGRCTIPFEWKHPYCHTSVQAICHSIITLFTTEYALDINLPSGLFSKRCGRCREDLKLFPLHALVMVAFYLGDRGASGETMFGAIATLSCMLATFADPTKAANISVAELFGTGTDTSENCTHSFITPSELASSLPDETLESWPHERQLGWRAFVAVLNFASPGEDPSSSSSEDGGDSDSFSEDDEELREKELGILWAASQTEMLTYRRVKTIDPWVSDRFDIQQLLRGLDDGLGLAYIPLCRDRLMRPFDVQGWFRNCHRRIFPAAQEICTRYFMNLEDWHRTTFIDAPMMI